MQQYTPQTHSSDHILSLSGTTAIYIEGMQIYRIRISDVRDEHGGFWAKANSLKTHGLLYRDTSWKFGAYWEWLSSSPVHFADSYVGWQLYTAPTVEEKIMAIVAKLPTGKTYLDDYTSKPVTSNNPRIMAINKPGQIAQELNEFLRHLQFDPMGISG